jgi:D-alanyl-D-alanine carboxypeptidase
MGDALAVGDFDGDGLDDLVASIPGHDVGTATDTGAVGVFYGDSAGIAAGPNELLTQALAASASDEAGDGFGGALAVGDFDGDGYDDLAIAAPYEDKSTSLPDTGLIVVYFGSSAGLAGGTVNEAFTQTSIAGESSEADDRMGWSLAAGDFDGDSYDDLAIGIPYEDTASGDEGVVGIMYGASGGLLPANSQLITQDSVPGTTASSDNLFGFALSSGDYDGDGYDDLGIGIPGASDGSKTGAGAIAIVPGTSAGLDVGSGNLLLQSDVSGLVTSGGYSIDANDAFGSALTSGDFQNDGYVDLAVGIPNKSNSTLAPNSGVVTVLHGSASGLDPASPTILNGNPNSSLEEGAQFGSTVTVGDMNGDGITDLAIGHQGQDVDQFANSGSISVFFGSAFPPLPVALTTSNWWIQRSFSDIENQADALFGASIAAGDFDGDGTDELAGGSPGRGGFISNVGGVSVATVEPAPLTTISARSAIVYDQDLDVVVAAKSPDRLKAMASTTKIMTALLIVEAVDSGSIALSDVVTVPSGAQNVGGGSHELYPNQTISVEDLLYMMMLESDNSAAMTLAVHLDGTVEDFTERMNDRAEELELIDTHYLAPWGRDPDEYWADYKGDATKCTSPLSHLTSSACLHYSTARDLARLADYSLSNATFADVASTPAYYLSSWTGTYIYPVPPTSPARQLCTTNRLMEHTGSAYIAACGWDSSFYRATATGVKTGTTDRAGACLVASDIGDVTANDLITVVLDSANLRNTDTTALLGQY